MHDPKSMQNSSKKIFKIAKNISESILKPKAIENFKNRPIPSYTSFTTSNARLDNKFTYSISEKTAPLIIDVLILLTSNIV